MSAKLLTVQDVASTIPCSQATVRRWIDVGLSGDQKLQRRKIRGRVYIERKELDRFLKATDEGYSN
jgi:hypothetical protein